MGPAVAAALHASYDFGRERMEEITDEESVRRGFSRELVRQYLTHYIHFELTADFRQGMQRFLASAR
jgi:predicted solute-binding protein